MLIRAKTQCSVLIEERSSLYLQPQTLGYGFDDGPNCSHNAFYDYLTTQEQKASE